MVKPVVSVCAPAVLGAAALGFPGVAALALVLLVLTSVLAPDDTRKAFKQSVWSVIVIGMLVFTLAITFSGALLFYVGYSAVLVSPMVVGSVVTLVGLRLTKAAWLTFVWPEKPVPPPPAVPVVIEKPVPVTHVEVVRPPSPPPPPPLPPPPKPKPRELVLWAGMRRPAEMLDQGFYCLSGPPGRGKSTIKRLFLKEVIRKILDDPDSETVLIDIDPAREDYAWIASQMPKERDSLVPLRLFCPSDPRTCTIDWDYDFHSPANHETYALAMSPMNPQLTQPFFENAMRTGVEGLCGAIQRKMGFWNDYILMNALSRPGYAKKLLGKDKYTEFIKELYSPKGGETAQNIVMEVVSKLSKWRKVAAHLSHVKKGRKVSLERFLSKRGIFVMQKDNDYREQHNAVIAMLLLRIGQILMKRPEDPTGQAKVFIVVDEFPSFGCIPGFIDMLRELRKRGVVFLLVWQSFANVKAVWKEEAYSLQGTLQNFMATGSADPVDAEHVSKLIGKARGWEAEYGQSTSDGTNENETEGTSNSTQWNFSQTRLAGSFRQPPPWFGPYAPGFHATDTKSVGGSRTEQYSKGRGVSHQDTKSVTWKYFERDIKSPTEVMRCPWPTREGGFHGIGYCVGEPAPCDVFYESEFMEREGLFDKHDHIPDYQEWPSEKYQLLEPLSQGVLERLGLLDVDPSDPDAYPTPEESGSLEQETPSGPRREDGSESATQGPQGLTEGEHDQWRDDFLNGQE